MIVTRVYTGDDGETHVEDLELPMAENGRGTMSELLQLTGGYFRASSYDGPLPFHNARWRHLCIPLRGSFEIECGDGTKRLIGPGTIMLGEDTTGRGHASIEVDVPRETLFLPLPDDFDTSSWKRVEPLQRVSA
jgi:hypothetical protein